MQLLYTYFTLSVMSLWSVFFLRLDGVVSSSVQSEVSTVVETSTIPVTANIQIIEVIDHTTYKVEVLNWYSETPNPQILEIRMDDQPFLYKDQIMSLLQTGTYWQVTMQGDKRTGIYVLRSAYGLGDLDNIDQNEPFPAPLFYKTNKKQASPNQIAIRSMGPPDYNQLRVIELTNLERLNNGNLPPLKARNTLHDAADDHTEQMVSGNFFAHTDLNTCSSPWERMTAAGYTNYNSAAENLTAGQSSAESAIASWMNSSGHRANILSLANRALGAGYGYDASSAANVARNNTGGCSKDFYHGPYYYYWTQNFGRKNNAYPMIINREAIETTITQVDLYVYGTPAPVQYPSNYYATSMRFSNDNVNWSSWEPYQANKTWTLSAGNGTKTVYSQIRNSAGAVRSAQDQIILNASCGTMTFANQTITGTQSYTDCEIIANPNVTIDGNIEFNANTIELGSNVTIPLGSTFTATTN